MAKPKTKPKVKAFTSCALVAPGGGASAARVAHSASYEPNHSVVGEGILNKFHTLYQDDETMTHAANTAAQHMLKKRTLDTTFHWISEMSASSGRDWISVLEDEGKTRTSTTPLR